MDLNLGFSPAMSIVPSRVRTFLSGSLLQVSHVTSLMKYELSSSGVSPHEYVIQNT